MNKKKFAKTKFDKKPKIFIIYVSTLKAPPKSVKIITHLSQIAQNISDNLI